MYVLNVYVNNVKLKIGGFKKGILFYICLSVLKDFNVYFLWLIVNSM